jgi:predicted transcriptional regulator
MLEVIEKPTNKTNIMYSARLSYPQLVEYTKYMLANELYDYNKQDHTYKLSERGREVLKAYRNIPDIKLV